MSKRSRRNRRRAREAAYRGRVQARLRRDGNGCLSCGLVKLIALDDVKCSAHDKA